MDDSRLEQLLAMANELDEFERDLGVSDRDEARAPMLRLHTGEPRMAAGAGRRTTRRSAWTGAVVGVVGLAAAFAIAFITSRPVASSRVFERELASATPVKPPIVEPHGPKATTPGGPAMGQLTPGEIERLMAQFDGSSIVKPADPTAPADQQQNMVLAMYEGTDPKTGKACDNCECVQWWNHDWGHGRAIDDVPPGELLGTSMAHSCMPSPRRLIVVGLTGPASELPVTEAQARQVVQCIMGRQGEHQCGDRDSSLSSGATYCLPKTVTVRVQMLGN